MSSKCKNKKCGNKKCGKEEVYRDDWKVNMTPEIPDWLPAAMSICKVILILVVFVIASFQWGYTKDLLWQCVWSLSLIKLVELSDE